MSLPASLRYNKHCRAGVYAHSYREGGLVLLALSSQTEQGFLACSVCVLMSSPAKFLVCRWGSLYIAGVTTKGKAMLCEGNRQSATRSKQSSHVHPWWHLAKCAHPRHKWDLARDEDQPVSLDGLGVRSNCCRCFIGADDLLACMARQHPVATCQLTCH